MKATLKPLLIAFGTVSVALAILGIFLPLLPTTPFLLLAAMCYAKSSPRFYRWLINHRWFGEYIRNFRDGRGMLLRHKMFAVTTVCLTIGYSIGFVVTNLWIKLLLAAIGLTVTVYLLRLKIRRG